jgi:hypothetical protein
MATAGIVKHTWGRMLKSKEQAVILNILTILKEISQEKYNLDSDW